MEALFGSLSDPLLSIMLFLFHHHFEPRHKNPPRYDSGPELIEHVFVDVIGKVEALMLFLKVSLMEAEWFFVLLRSSP